MLAPALCPAQDKMAEALRKGIVEEDANRNLDAAIQSYQTVLAQFDEDRKSAATALFRIAECYRKQGKNDQATAAYKRVVQEFADQTKLADQSRSHLPKEQQEAGVGGARAAYFAGSPDEQRAILDARAQKMAEARLRVRAVLEERLKNAEDDLARAEAAGRQLPLLRDAVTAHRARVGSSLSTQIQDPSPERAAAVYREREELTMALQKAQDDFASAQTLANRIPEFKERILDLRQQLAAFDLETAQQGLPR